MNYRFLDMHDESPIFSSIREAIGLHIEARGWSQADLARVLGWSAQSLSNVVNHRSPLRPEEALDLSRALGGSALSWMTIRASENLNSAFQDSGTLRRLGEIDSRSRVERILPTREMIRRGTLPDSDPQTIEKAANKLLGISSIEDEIIFSASARRKEKIGPVSRQQLAWIAESRSLVSGDLPPLANVTVLEQLGGSLATTVRTREDFRELPERFSEVGIALVFVPPYSGGNIDGVCTVVNGHPLISISGRGGRSDKIMFTIAHELAHISLGHLENGGIYISDPESSERVEEASRELAADLQAGSWLVPDLEDLSTGPVTEAQVVELSRRRGISESLIIGRLQRDGRIPWNSRLNKRIPSVKEDLNSWN